MIQLPLIFMKHYEEESAYILGFTWNILNNLEEAKPYELKTNYNENVKINSILYAAYK